jgi:hypothetical protein
MAEPQPRSYRRAALFVDFENVHIGLSDSSPEAARAFATDPARWVRWMEQDLGSFRVDDDEMPRVLLRRICYLEPGRSGRYRSFFTRAGFRVVDCPPLTRMGKNSADIHMVLDILDTLTHPTRFDEFILLSADADFTPVFMRLREHDRRSAMLVSGPAAAALLAVSDFAIPETMFIEEALGLDTAEVPAESPAVAEAAPAAAPGEGVDAVRARIDAAVRQYVDTSPSPVELATAAHHIRKVVGREATVGWAGAGSFKQLIAAIQSDTLVLDPRHPGWLLDPRRHGPVAPTGAPEVAERVNRVVGVPLLGPDAYRTLFESVATDGRADPEKSESEAELIIREACGRRGQTVTRNAIHFVLVGLRYSGVDWRSADNDAAGLAAEFEANVLRLAANARMELSDEDRDQIHLWISGPLAAQ